MRILSITARNYRLHRDLNVELDPLRNLIGGPNEIGKSTLAEAMHRALFCRHRTGGELQQSMRSNIHNGQPEVKLVFEVGAQTWTLDKRFSGATGTIRLVSNDGTSLQGDDAEEKLAHLVGNQDGPANRLNELATRWAHLWVWQGTSGDDAAAHAVKRKDELVQRLQQQGLAAVMQSQTDERVRETIRTSHDAIYNKNGSFKANSKPDLANKQLAAAQADLSRAIEQKQRLESAIAEQEAAARLLAESTAALPAHRGHLATVNTSLAQVSDLRAREEMESLQLRNSVAAREQLAKVDRQILDLRKKAATARESLMPAEAKLSILTDLETSARTTATAADFAQRSVAETLRHARQLHDLAATCVSHFEKSAICADLTAKSDAIAVLTQALAADRGVLSKFPVITAPKVESLRKLDSQFRLAEGALQAIAAGVELVASDQPVLLDDDALTLGESRVISEAAELTIGTATRLRIRPGGGTSLGECRNQLDAIRQILAQALDSLTVADLAEAVEILAKRQVIEQRIGTIETQLRALGAKELPEALSAAIAAQLAALAEVDRRRAALGTPILQSMPQSLESARAWLTLTSEALEESERKETQLRNDADASRASHLKAVSAWQAHRESIDKSRSDLMSLEVSATALEANHGDATTRQLSLANSLAAESAAKATLEATTKALTDLNPKFLADEQARLIRVLASEEGKQRDAETRIAVARNILALDGSTDPDADMLEATVRLATFQDEYAREVRHANAIALLHRLFSESQIAISENLTQPIADRVAAYLECIFGRGVQVHVNLSDASKPALQLTRPGAPTFAFDSLSGGAKEQVASAVRLAMAEILASNHDGCLPLIFDDAFAYADPERVQALQRMLDLAANRGLQVIVLTCTPADYIGLGAKDIRLSPPSPTGGLDTPNITE
ncbi:MAG: AAA family ATPase [Verrucomicrobiota bacterium]